MFFKKEFENNQNGFCKECLSLFKDVNDAWTHCMCGACKSLKLLAAFSSKSQKMWGFRKKACEACMEAANTEHNEQQRAKATD
eukprot:724310-Karenia_brevis.AAC.1